ncbi:MAG: TonB-dependent receptor [Gammaproteobacteria bacterium]
MYQSVVTARAGSFLVMLCLCAAPLSAAQVLEEVFVTAQKRTESLQDVPISITAVSGEEIVRSGLGNMDALQGRIPNFQISEAAVSTEIYIRGVGSSANDGFEQSVGIFVDGVFGGRGRQFRAPFLDLERIEVLRGPQGVLLGKNTIAGAVNITTARPTSEFTGYINTRYNDALEEGAVAVVMSGPLSEDTRARIAISGLKGDGYLINTVDKTAEQQREEFVARGTLEHDFSDTLTARLKYEAGSFDTDGSRFVINEVGVFEDVFLSFDEDFSQTNYRSSKGGLGGEAEFDKTKTVNSVLNIDWEWDNHTLTSVTGYSNFKFRRRLDSDFSAIPLLITETLPEQFEQISQEFRLASDPGGRFDYIAGLYWQTNRYDTLRQTRIDGDTLAELLLGPLGNALGGAARTTTGRTFQKFDQEADSFAVFGELTWHVSDRLRAKAGLRYSDEEKSATQLVRLETLDGEVNTDPVSIQLTGLFFGFENHRFQGDRAESDVSPSLNLQFDLTDDMMIYGTWARGFKAGGFNAQERSDDIALFEFEEEQATTFELGFKGRFFGGAARINATAFQSTYDDLQVSSFNGVTFVVGNAAQSESTGFEIDGAWALSDSVEIGGALATLDSTYTSFPNGPCFAGDDSPECNDVSSAGARDLSGESTPFNADYSGNLYVRGSIELENEYAMTFDANWTFTDGYFYSADLDLADFEEAHGLVSIRVGVGPADGRWEFALLGQNLTEELTNGGYGSDIPLLTGAHFSSSIAPRRFSLQYTHRFGAY